MRLSKPTKHAFNTEGVSLTEPEHESSCDINIMVKSALRGLQVRSGPQPQFGYDDTTLDAVTHRIQKQELENELKISAKAELEPQFADFIPQSIKQKFGFKTKIIKEEQLPLTPEPTPAPIPPKRDPNANQS